MSYTAPIQRGIHMVEEDGHFRIAVSLRNLTDEPMTVRSMNGNMFDVSMKEVTFEEHGGDHLWSPSTASTAAVTHWTLGREGRVTRHFDVPNHDMSMQEAREWVDEGIMGLDDDEREYLLTEEGKDELAAIVEEYPEFNYVEPEEVGVVKIRCTFPSGDGYHDRLVRQFNLRSNAQQELSNELPAECRDTISRSM